VGRGVGRGGDAPLEQKIRPRDIVTRESLENAARVVACSGGSTNGALHLPAIAHECGIEFDLHDVAAIFRDTPTSPT
jgi:dihydroxy-acid dehydratase